MVCDISHKKNKTGFSKNQYLHVLIIFLLSCLFLSLLELRFRFLLTSPLDFFNGGASDGLMQTLPYSTLISHPVMSILYLHKQPPLLDLIRYLVALSLYGRVENLAMSADHLLHLVWIVFYGIQVSLVFTIFSFFSKKRYVAYIFSIIWMLHPGAIYFGSLFEATTIAATLVLWFFLEMILVNHDSFSPIRLGICTILLVMAKTIFQWFFLPLAIICLVFKRVTSKQIFLFAAIIFTVLGMYFAKQIILFKTISTTTFAGYHFCGILWHEPNEMEINAISSRLVFNYPEQAKQLFDIPHNEGSNDEQTYKDNLIYTSICRGVLFSHPISSLKHLAKSFSINLNSYLKPSSDYGYHFFISKIPFSKYYNIAFSGINLWLSFMLAIMWWIYRNIVLSNNKSEATTTAIAIALPWLYIFIITNLVNRYVGPNQYDWTEADRLKFVLEPISYIFVVIQLLSFIEWICIKTRIKALFAKL